MKKSDFARLVDKAFIPLESQYQFKRVASSFHSGGVEVTFQNPTTELCLNYEIGSFPWITIGDIKNPKEDRVSLDWLLVELDQRESPTPDETFFPKGMEDNQLEAELQTKIKELLKFGKEMLAGDFSLMPKIKTRADDYLAECRKIADRYKTS
jgi:hypothetical protein